LIYKCLLSDYFSWYFIEGVIEYNKKNLQIHISSIFKIAERQKLDGINIINSYSKNLKKLMV